MIKISTYIHFTKEQREQARCTDLAQFLISHGEKVKKSGSEYEWLDGSQKVTIRGHLWYHQYEQKGGDAIDFIRRFYNKDYAEAVEMLLNNCGGQIITSPPIEKSHKPFELPPRNDRMSRVFSYLLLTRGIDKDAKIISKTIILSGMDSASFGQNAYFYDAAEGLLTATILLVSEFCEPKERHIVSVFKIIQELLAPTNKKGKNQFQLLMDYLPDDHKAKWFAGAALNTAEQSMSSVMSTALSRLNAFLDSELEQLLCFDTEIDAEKFCNEKCAIFIVMPEENPNTFFMVSLIIQQLYREILSVADENGGVLKNRCVFFCDEFGTLPKIDSAEMMFSASRSRRLQIVPIIQSFAQLEKNYGKEGADVIIDNTQLTIFGGFAPNSTSAEVLSKALGSRTVMSGSVSRSKNDPSQSLQMIERSLMTPDELKSLPKGTFVVMKTGFYPMKVKLKLFFKWGIKFEEKYEVMENGNREVHYANRSEFFNNIIQTYCPHYLEQPVTDSGFDEANGEKKKKNENLKTSPNAEESAPLEKSTKNENTKKKTAPIRTERPSQEVQENE